MLEHVVAVRKETLDEKDHERLISEHELARAYLDDRRTTDAIKIFEHVVAVRKETLDEKDHERLISEHALARAYLDNRRIKDAIEILEHVVAIEAETLPENDPRRQLSANLLQSCFEGLEAASDDNEVRCICSEEANGFALLKLYDINPTQLLAWMISLCLFLVLVFGGLPNVT
ncbi:hypothetical protein FOMG_17382 [Fusarium oxysporum f. sp. melonis 26406]|uniref:Uncharacterized protein n=1 Tax=Fusarium oxysporum f. sp. melonis 26406 TaxID=1089452 RepID=W9ZY90_FUSOX|nr:hypothetical protein FOMG_17382 [Fusarium oxysporum f. sp. melonis 26406]